MSISSTECGLNLQEYAGMVPIRFWKDVSPFQNKVVAYVSDLYILHMDNRDFSLPGDRELHFGHVDRVLDGWWPFDPYREETGFNLDRLIRKGEISYCTTYLTDRFLVDYKVVTAKDDQEPQDHFFMREATENEYFQIISALESEEAKFEILTLKKVKELFAEVVLRT